MGKRERTDLLTPRLDRLFPRLPESQFEITSPVDATYNCIAWAAGDHTTWWWPDALGNDFWPSQAPRTETLDGFQLAYATVGYAPCEDAILEQDCEKIAIYVGPNGVPTHAAKQLPGGRWTSKLGQLEDIEHSTLGQMEGALYGVVGVILRRRVDKS